MQHTQNILHTFHSIHPHIQFTLEIESNNQINFLHMTLTRLKNNQIITEWYTKPTFFSRLLNFHSTQPLTHKINIIQHLSKSSIHLSHSINRSKQIKKTKNILRQNNSLIL
jgi:hypothetical protein